MKWFLKRQLSNRNRFFNGTLPYETKQAFFMAFRLLETHSCLISLIIGNFELIFLIEKNLYLNKIYTKSEQNMPNIACSHKILNLNNSLRKRNQKNFLVPKSTLDELFSDTTHISLRWLHRSAKIVKQKKPFEYIVPPPTCGVGTKI